MEELGVRGVKGELQEPIKKPGETVDTPFPSPLKYLPAPYPLHTHNTHMLLPHCISNSFGLPVLSERPYSAEQALLPFLFSVWPTLC